MKPLALRTRMFLASALVAVVSIGSVLLFVSWRVTREGEARLAASGLTRRQSQVPLRTRLSPGFSRP